MLRTLQPPAPLTKGQPFELHCHASCVPVTLRKIVAGIDKAGVRTERKPRALLPGSGAVVQLELERPVAIEKAEDVRQMGRVVLREAGATLAAGVVTAGQGETSASTRVATAVGVHRSARAGRWRVPCVRVLLRWPLHLFPCLMHDGPWPTRKNRAPIGSALWRWRLAVCG
eukprot:6742956-Prymnesium_polylepis.1